MKLWLEVRPGKRFNRILFSNNSYIIHLAAPPVDGKANEALVNYLAGVLKTSPSRVHLLKGSKSRRKMLEVDLDQQAVMQLLNTEAGKQGL